MIALYGGTFNPTHNGHIALIKELERLKLFSKIIVIPNYYSPLKTEMVVDPKHRLAMLKLALADQPNLEVSTIEINAPKPSYSFDTVSYYKRKFPDQELVFVCGADAFSSILDWYEYAELLKLCSFLVVHRKGLDEYHLFDVFEELKEESLIKKEIKDGSLPLAHYFETKANNRIYLINFNLPEVSSTEIRIKSQFGESIQNLVPAAVDCYLKDHPLYGIDANS